ncbi:MAG: hypothetical protein IJ053_03635 [Lachnospiraceae bacterium]|nr:hypothetical protein [Lachnospiraceae bacterium]
MSRLQSYFNFKDLPYADSTLGITISLSGAFRVDYTDNTTEAKMHESEQTIKEAVTNLFLLTAQEGFPYESLYREQTDISNMLKQVISGTESMNEHIGIENLTITELYPADTDYPKIIEAKKTNAMKAATQPTSQHADDTSYTNNTSPPANNAAYTNQADNWICGVCGNQARGKFCPKCGSPKQASGSPTTNMQRKLCPACRADLTDRPQGLKFCPKCGVSIV